MSVVCDVVLLTCFKLAALLCVASKAARGKRGAHCWVFVNHLLLKTSPSVRIIMDSDDDGIEMPVWSVSGGLTVDGEESMEEFLDREFQDLPEFHCQGLGIQDSHFLDGTHGISSAVYGTFKDSELRGHEILYFRTLNYSGDDALQAESVESSLDVINRFFTKTPEAIPNEPAMTIGLLGEISFDATSLFQRTIRQALASVVSKTGAWLVTGGVYGMAQLAGSVTATLRHRALMHHTNSNEHVGMTYPVIGVAKWRAVPGHERLAERNQHNVRVGVPFPAADLKHNGRALDGNHTIYVFVDDVESAKHDGMMCANGRVGSKSGLSSYESEYGVESEINETKPMQGSQSERQVGDDSEGEIGIGSDLADSKARHVLKHKEKRSQQRDSKASAKQFYATNSIQEGRWSAPPQIEYRIGLELAMQGRYNSCPVTVLVGGGLDALDEVNAYVAAGIPIVIMDGSGGAADALATTYRFLHINTSTSASATPSGLRRVVRSYFDVDEKDAIDQTLSLLLECVRKPWLLIVCEVGHAGLDASNVERALLKAVQSCNVSLVVKLQLAISFGDLEFGRLMLKEIMTVMNGSAAQDVLHDSLMHALLHQSTDFVGLLLDYGAKPSLLRATVRLKRNRMTANNPAPHAPNDGSSYKLAIQQLYQMSALACPHLDVLMKMIRRSWLHNKCQTCFNLFKRHRDHDVVRSDGQHVKTKASRRRLSGLGLATQGLQDIDLTLDDMEEKIGRLADSSVCYNKQAKNVSTKQRAMQSLFLWAVCANNCNLATLFWRLGSDNLANALFASQLLSKLSTSPAFAGPEWVNERTSLLDNSKLFEGLAVKLLTECSHVNTDLTHKLLTLPSPLLGTDLLEFAYFSQALEFTGHDASQATIHSAWQQSDGPGWFSASARFRFGVDLISHLLLCISFSYVVLTPYATLSTIHKNTALHWTEWLHLRWFMALVIEELRRLFTDARVYFSDGWNYIDTFSQVTFFLGVGFRTNFSDKRQYHDTALALQTVTVVALWLRVLQYFAATRLLGPKLMMINQLLKNVAVFICFLSVFLLAYGVAAQGITFPATNVSRYSLSQVFYQPYFQLFGDLFTDQMQADLQCNNASPFSGCTSPLSSILVIIFSAYLLVTKILLVAFLIAMFTYTYSSSRVHARKAWLRYNFAVLHEFRSKPLLPGPFSLLYTLGVLFYNIYMATLHKMLCNRSSGSYTVTHDLALSHQLELFQHTAVDQILQPASDISSSSVQDVIFRQQFQSSTQSTAILQTFSTRSVASGMQDVLTGRGISAATTAVLSPPPPTRSTTMSAPPRTLSASSLQPASHAASTSVSRRTSLIGQPGLRPQTEPINPRLITFNTFDEHFWVDRTTCHPSNAYKVRDGIPRNPFEKLETSGRGTLSRWGVNKCDHVLIYRWRRAHCLNVQGVSSQTCLRTHPAGFLCDCGPLQRNTRPWLEVLMVQHHQTFTSRVHRKHRQVQLASFRLPRMVACVQNDALVSLFVASIVNQTLLRPEDYDWLTDSALDDASHHLRNLVKLSLAPNTPQAQVNLRVNAVDAVTTRLLATEVALPQVYCARDLANTDNAWLESRCLCLHDVDESVWSTISVQRRALFLTQFDDSDTEEESEVSDDDLADDFKFFGPDGKLLQGTYGLVHSEGVHPQVLTRPPSSAASSTSLSALFGSLSNVASSSVHDLRSRSGATSPTTPIRKPHDAVLYGHRKLNRITSVQSQRTRLVTSISTASSSGRGGPTQRRLSTTSPRKFSRSRALQRSKTTSSFTFHQASSEVVDDDTDDATVPVADAKRQQGSAGRRPSGARVLKRSSTVSEEFSLGETQSSPGDFLGVQSKSATTTSGRSAQVLAPRATDTGTATDTFAAPATSPLSSGSPMLVDLDELVEQSSSALEVPSSTSSSHEVEHTSGLVLSTPSRDGSGDEQQAAAIVQPHDAYKRSGSPLSGRAASHAQQRCSTITEQSSSGSDPSNGVYDEPAQPRGSQQGTGTRLEDEGNAPMLSSVMDAIHSDDAMQCTFTWVPVHRHTRFANEATRAHVLQVVRAMDAHW
eukprot:m.140648 g.140648  ORF g.140648 m.140648 type:complete len:2044 (-) comp14034_c0_seq14:472-6603(-)